MVGDDLFAIPYLDGYLLYSPLQGLLVLITGAGLASILLNPTASMSTCLSECEIKPDEDLIRLLDTKARLHPRMCNGHQEDDFLPTQLTLSLTSACQMACIYCYIHGGDSPRAMSWKTAEAALRTVFDNSVARSKDTFEVEFHGQGEPTANWPLLRQSVLLAEDLCDREGLTPRFSLVTNGILSTAKASFLAEHGFRVGISMDGLQEIMDVQRPLRSGASSFETLMRSLRLLEEHHVDYCIRSTVTSIGVQSMKDFAVFVREKTKCRYINFEPVCETGRARDAGLADSDLMSKFLIHFREASAFGRQNGMQIGLSSCRLDGLRSSFCSAYGPDLNFCVSTDGFVSSCYEVLDLSDPRGDMFIYGCYDPSLNAFVLDNNKVRRLRSLDVTGIERCRDCFVKWNCGGDCIAKAALGGLQAVIGSEALQRCFLTRNITADELLCTLFAPSQTGGGDALV
ncbi:MAG: radical SAM protein [bacterium]|nr:radical SAM protein [bacterium]